MSGDEPLPLAYRPDFRARPFGYSRRDVEVAFAEGRMVVQALRAQVENLDGTVARLEQELHAARGEVADVRARETEVQRLTLDAERRAAEIEEEARARARELLDDARSRAELARNEASLRAEEAARQLDELLRVREELLGSARAAARQLEAAVERIARGELDEPPTADGPPAARRAAPGEEDVGPLFETHVLMDAGPFGGFAELSTFERMVGRIAAVRDVYVSAFAGGRATIELTLREPTQLVGELRAALPHDAQVLAATSRSVKVELAGTEVSAP